MTANPLAENDRKCNLKRNHQEPSSLEKRDLRKVTNVL
jgi:hypothetical protein